MKKFIENTPPLLRREDRGVRFFVAETSIVREIWGKADTVLFIFAGSAAEFALNKAVDWLYFTGKIPKDPLGRLFSTVAYAQKIIYSDYEKAIQSIDQITAIHQGVEQNRQAKIPDWAYRDVLYMLIDYSIIAYELLERKLETHEKEEVFDVFYRVGKQMKLKDLPENYENWLSSRQFHLENDLILSHYSHDLFIQYKKHLGLFRFQILIEVQKILVPPKVFRLLNFHSTLTAFSLLNLYKLGRKLNLDSITKQLLLPKKYKIQIEQLNQF